MWTDDDDDNDLSGETNTGTPKDIQQYTYVQKALFKLHMMITLDLIEIIPLQKNRQSWVRRSLMVSAASSRRGITLSEHPRGCEIRCVEIRNRSVVVFVPFLRRSVSDFEGVVQV